MCRLAADPLLALRVGAATVQMKGADWAAAFIGVLGWQDTVLPSWYIDAAQDMLGVAALGAIARRDGTGLGGRVLVAVGLLGCVAAMLAIQYVTWTVPGKPIVDGIQGRYFLPRALPAVALLPAFGDRWLWRPHLVIVCVTALFSRVTLVVTIQTVVWRYYLG